MKFADSQLQNGPTCEKQLIWLITELTGPKLGLNLSEKQYNFDFFAFFYANQGAKAWNQRTQNPVKIYH